MTRFLPADVEWWSLIGWLQVARVRRIVTLFLCARIVSYYVQVSHSLKRNKDSDADHVVVIFLSSKWIPEGLLYSGRRIQQFWLVAGGKGPSVPNAKRGSSDDALTETTHPQCFDFDHIIIYLTHSQFTDHPTACILNGNDEWRPRSPGFFSISFSVSISSVISGTRRVGAD